MASGAIVHLFEYPAINLWQSTGAPVHYITEYREPEFIFDFETAQELDPDPNGQDEQVNKSATSATLAQLLLSMVEQCRVKITLAHCASSLYQRNTIPLFILFHAWKHFPA